MRTQHRFGRRRPFTALGRGAVNSRKFPRGENDTPRRSWGRSAFPPAILFGDTRRSTSTPRRFVVRRWRLADALLPPPPSGLSNPGQRVFSQEARSLGVLCEAQPANRGVFAAPLFS